MWLRFFNRVTLAAVKRSVNPSKKGILCVYAEGIVVLGVMTSPLV